MTAEFRPEDHRLYEDHYFELIDTGGYVIGSDDVFEKEIDRQLGEDADSEIISSEYTPSSADAKGDSSGAGVVDDG